LSLEALRDDALKFLGLLYQRTKFDPKDWVSFDINDLAGRMEHFELNSLNAVLPFIDQTMAKWFFGTLISSMGHYRLYARKASS
jgi:hypothetical protein